jgi:hypothetical protein
VGGLPVVVAPGPGEVTNDVGVLFAWPQPTKANTTTAIEMNPALPRMLPSVAKAPLFPYRPARIGNASEVSSSPQVAGGAGALARSGGSLHVGRPRGRLVCASMSTPRAIACLFAALAVAASGCGGSTKTASTSASAPVTSTSASTSTPASTSAPGVESSHTLSRSTSSKEAQHTASHPKAAEKAAQAKPNREPKASKRHVEAKPSETGPLAVPAKKQYPAAVRRRFLGTCEAGKGSPSRCGCILARQELSNVEKGQSVAEMLALEAALHLGPLEEVRRRGASLLPEAIRHSLERCKSTTK